MVEYIDALLRPPKVVSPDGGFDLQVLPGAAIVRATCPGYLMGELAIEVSPGSQSGPVIVRLGPKSTPG
jgi:hypothetical protein